uniref:ORF69d n=1 Tax=Pinus koraiensis TaxID=88728 RepID=Q85WZ1_PINKO|nr:ORF69d [Pinus koraiensis]AAO74078.1 ORF69d [Pinus koraiensis]
MILMLYHTAFRRVVNEPYNIGRRFLLFLLFPHYQTPFSLHERSKYHFSLAEKSIYEVIVSTHSYWILAI